MPITAEGLSRLSLFSGLEESILETLAAQFQEQNYAVGQIAVLEGDPCASVLLVGQGVVQLRLLSLEGREHVLAYLGQGSCPHLAAVLDGGVHLSTIEALTVTKLYAMPREQFLELLRQHTTLAVAVARHLAEEVRLLTGMVKDLALHPVRIRLARFLLAHAESGPAQHTWTQEAIAARIGTVRDVVGRTLRAFADEGLIRRQHGRLVIANREGLEREAQNEAIV